LLEKNPVDRYQTATDVIAALQDRRCDDAHISTTTFTTPGAERPHLLRSKFVGRKPELERLDRLLDGVLKCQGRFAVICGEAGVGKTRLVEELKAGAFLEGFRYLVGNCFEKEGIFYQPFVEALREVNRSIGQYDLEWEGKMIGPLGRELARLVPELGERESVKKLPEPVAFGEREDKLRLFDAVTRFFISLSRQEPVLLLLDDLHWADELTCELLHYFVRNTKKERVLLVINYRIEEIIQRQRRHHPLDELLASMAKEGLTDERLQLKRLDNDQTAEMLASLLGDGRVPWQLVTTVGEKTGGNPFMIEEMLKAMLDAGAVLVRDDGVALRGLDEVDVPTSVRDLIERRLSRLADANRDFLAIAAAIGHQFSFDVVCAVTGLPEEDVLDALDDVLRLKLVAELDVRGAGDLYEFTHPMIREVLYRGINRRKKKRLHEKIAASIETHFAAELEAHIEELVVHWTAAGDEEKILTCSLSAARKAFRAYANDQAIHFFEQVLELSKANESIEGAARRLEVLGDLLDVLDRKGRWEEGLWRMDEFRAACEQMGDPQHLSEAHRRRGFFLHRAGKVAEAMVEYNQALDALGRDRESAEALKLLHELSRLYFWTNELEIAQRMSAKAMALAEQLKDAREIAHLHNLHACIHQAHGRIRDSLEGFTQAHAAFTSLNDVRGLLFSHNNLGGSWEALGEYAKALEFKTKGLELARSVGDVSFAGWMHMSLATTLIRQGRWREADEHLEQAAATCAQIGDRRSAVRVDLQKARLLYLRGRFSEASALLASTRDAAREMEDFAIVSDAVIYLANLHRKAGRLEQAIPFAQEARKLAASQERAGSVADAHGTLAEIYRDLGNWKEAEAHIGRADAAVAKGDQKLPVLEMQWVRATIDAAQGRIEPAVAALTAARDAYQALALPYEAAVARAELGIALARSGTPAARAAAGREFAGALETFSTLGAAYDVERVKAQVVRLDEPPRPGSAPSHAATADPSTAASSSAAGAGGGGGATPSAARVPVPQLRAPRFVGRSRETADLAAAFAGVIRDTAGVFLLVSGETGIGKTRLFDEFRGTMTDRGVPVLVAKCRAEARHISYAPFLAMIETTLSRLREENDADLLRALAPVVPVFLPVLPELKSLPWCKAIEPAYPLGPSEERHRFVDAVFKLLTTLVSARGLVLIIDDIQFADEASLGLLHFLVRNVRELPVLVLANVNPVEIDGPDHPFLAIRQDMTRERFIKQSELTSLAYDDARALVRSLLDTDQEPEGLVDVLWEKTEGNPFFLRELLASLVRTTLVRRDEAGSAWLVSPGIRDAALPQNLVDLIRSRFAKLDVRAMRFLEYAAGIGREFELDLVLKAVGLELEEGAGDAAGAAPATTGPPAPAAPSTTEGANKPRRRDTHLGELAEDEALDLLDDLISSGILVETKPGMRKEETFLFGQGKFRDVIYEGIPPERRRHIHARIGRALERLHFKKLPAIAGELAYHFQRSGDVKKALEYLNSAGERAQRIYANEEALSFYGTVLSLMEEHAELAGAAPPKRIDLLNRIGDLLLHVGRWDEAAERYRQAMALALAHGDGEKIAEIHQRIGRFYEGRSRYEEALREYEAGLSILKPEHSRSVAGAIRLNLGWIHYLKRDFDRAAEYGRTGMEHLAGASDAVLRARLANLMGLIATDRGDWVTAMKHFEAALAAHTEAGDKVGIGIIYNNQAKVYLDLLGDLDKSTELLEKALALNQEIGNVLWQGGLNANLGKAEYDLGLWERASGHFLQGLAIATRLGNSRLMWASHMGLGVLFMSRGSFTTAQIHLERALRLVDQAGLTEGVTTCWLNLGMLHQRAGRLGAAREAIERVRQRAEMKPVEAELLEASTGLTLYYAEIGEVALAEESCARALALAEKFRNLGMIGQAKRGLGMLRKAEGRLQEAAAALGESVETYKRVKFAYEEALSQAEYGLVLERLERGSGAEYLRRARGTLERLGAKWDLERVGRAED
ncbi:MAG: tetratricopeptide repeat protein, partial [Planctomycetes bacterium]|nr:tetratricopeptide repeat protein [Planctomycetota bacterium]